MYVTILIIIACVILYYFTEREGRYGSEDIFNRLCLIPIQVRRGEWYRLLTSAFLHGSVGHILMNMVALYNIGSGLEPLVGSFWYTLVLVVSILGGGFMILQGDKSWGRTVGMSGGIYGLMVFYFVFLYRYGYFAYSSILYSVLRTVLINVAISFMPGISLRGHLGGAIAGLLMGILYFFIL